MEKNILNDVHNKIALIMPVCVTHHYSFGNGYVYLWFQIIAYLDWIAYF